MCKLKISFRSSNKKLRNPKENEALDISEDIQAKPIITRVSQPRFTLSWESYQNRLCKNLNTLFTVCYKVFPIFGLHFNIIISLFIVLFW